MSAVSIPLALRNLLRHRLRTAMTAGVIVFGVAGLILSGGFVHDIFIQLGEALIHSQSGHLQLARKGYFDGGTSRPEQFRIAKPAEPMREVGRVPGVRSVMARLHFSGLLNNGQADWPIVGEGVEPSKEAALGTYMRIVSGRALTDADDLGVMLGSGVAQVLKLAPGDRATLLANTSEGALNTLEFTVVGVFETFSRDFDARAVRIPLKAAQDLLGTEGANVLVVSLDRTDRTDEAAAALAGFAASQGLEVRTWRALNDFYEKTVTLYRNQFGVLQLITLAMVLLSVANTVNMSVFERVGEFGTMRALGNRSADVFRLVMIENLWLGAVAAAVGVVAGVLLAVAISAVGIPMPPPPNANLGYRAMIRVVPEVLAIAFAVGVVATGVAALLPALRVSRIRIEEALRANI